MVNWKSKKLGDLLLLANGVVLIILLNLLASQFFFRVDLTEEKRYSIKPQTKKILHDLDDNVYIEVFLEGEMNAGFRRFQRSIKETLEEFRRYSKNKIQIIYTDPSLALSEKARGEFMADLAAKGIQPTNVIDKQNGQRVEKIIFPGVLISYGGMEKGVMLLKGNKARSPEEEINQSIEGVEFELANTIYNLTSLNRKRIGLVKGHNELDSIRIASIVEALFEVYDVADVSLRDTALSEFDALVIAKPTQRFSPADRFLLDQYIMNGGNTLFLIDKLDASMDSASQQQYFAFPYNTELDDMLFRYGVRINPDLIQDKSAGFYPVVVRESGGKPQIQLMDWPFFPLVNRYANHPITRNLDAVLMKFTSSLDTVKASGIRKTPLMFTSQNSKVLAAPVNININNLRATVDPASFDKQFLPVGYLLEGKFTSVFKNRFLPDEVKESKFREIGEEAKIIVVSDGDLMQNGTHPKTRQPLPLGFDPASNYTFANQDLLLNMIAWLTDENGLIHTRNKEVKIRPLNREKVEEEKIKWQVINVILPIVLLLVFGVLRSVLRKRKYASA
jgi:gliding-associated putative ABC transporter substrate-binding component GldG